MLTQLCNALYNIVYLKEYKCYVNSYIWIKITKYYLCVCQDSAQMLRSSLIFDVSSTNNVPMDIIWNTVVIFLFSNNAKV